MSPFWALCVSCALFCNEFFQVAAPTLPAQGGNPGCLPLWHSFPHFVPVTARADNGQISGPEKLQVSSDFRTIGLSIFQSLEFSFGRLHCFLAVLLRDFVSSMNRVNSEPAGRVSRLVVRELTCPGWNSRELIEVFCSIQSRVVKQLNFPPNSVFYCTFDARFL